MQRQLLIAAAAFFICSCNASDASVGVNSGTDKNPDGAAANSLANLARIDLGTLGGSSSYAADLNSSNIVVGWSETAAGATHAFRWTSAAGMIDLGTLPGHSASRAVAIVDTQNAADAQILGVSGDGDRWTPVVWKADGSIAELPVPLGQDSQFNFPTAFNARGDVVGWDTGTPFQQGWVWSATDGKYDLAAHLPGGTSESSAAAITASGEVVITAHGWVCSHNPSCWRTYVWSKAAGFVSLPTPANNREADVTGLGLNDAGAVVGWVTTNGGDHPAPYLWTASAGFKLLPHYPSGSNGYAAAVNSLGTVVGADFDPVSGSMIASAWSASGSISKLTADATPSVAVAINDFGTIAGWAALTGGANHAVIWKAASSGARSILSAPTTISPRVTTNSTACLTSSHAIISRAALFDCVSKADRKR